MKLQFSPPIASLTVDCTIFGFVEGKIKILLIQRSSKPEEGKWALPGGFVEKKETLEEAADRVLELLTGVNGIYMEQVKAFSAIDRHPLDRVITIGFCALVNPELFELEAGEHAKNAKWFDLTDKPQLPFDHEEIFNESLQYLRRELKLKPIGFELLAKKFTLTDLQHLYEAVAGMELDRRNFRRKIKSFGILKELKEKKKGAHISAGLFEFDKKAYDKMMKDGFEFKL